MRPKNIGVKVNNIVKVKTNDIKANSKGVKASSSNNTSKKQRRKVLKVKLYSLCWIDWMEALCQNVSFTTTYTTKFVVITTNPTKYDYMIS